MHRELHNARDDIEVGIRCVEIARDSLHGGTASEAQCHRHRIVGREGLAGADRSDKDAASRIGRPVHSAHRTRERARVEAVVGFKGLSEHGGVIASRVAVPHELAREDDDGGRG